MIERDKYYRMQKQRRGQEDTDIIGCRDRLKIGRDKYSKTRDKLRGQKEIDIPEQDIY